MTLRHSYHLHVFENYLCTMPCFELCLVLQRYPLIILPHLLHDLSEVLAFGSINIHVDTHGADLGTQFSNILLRGEIDRE